MFSIWRIISKGDDDLRIGVFRTVLDITSSLMGYILSDMLICLVMSLDPSNGMHLLQENFDEYQLIRPLGRGAMGQVFLAYDTQLDRTVAIKFLGAARTALIDHERFAVEARAIARLSHPNVVAVHRLGEVAGKPYLVSEYVKGKSLDQIEKPLLPTQIVRIGLGLARGLAAAHRKGVLHRDIKPANVMITQDGEVKLLDFGLAKLLDIGFTSTDVTKEEAGLRAKGQDPSSTQHLTQTGSLLGTPVYMAPEVWNGQPASLRSDVYSLGALLYQLCSGRPPHEAGTLWALRSEVVDRDALPLTSVAPGTPRRLVAVVERCLRRDPSGRFASGEDLCREFERLAQKSSPLQLAMLSLFWPGLGQLANRRIMDGVLWMLYTLLAYYLSFILGVFLHIICVVYAYRRIGQETHRTWRDVALLVLVILICTAPFIIYLFSPRNRELNSPFPRNLNLEEGVIGQQPVGWIVPSSVKAGGYRAILIEDHLADGKRCACISHDAPSLPWNLSNIKARIMARLSPFGNMMQSIDATPYRGKQVRLRAAVRIDASSPNDRAQLWIRVDRKRGWMVYFDDASSVGFFDNMDDQPITSNLWHTYELVGRVSTDAESINFGLILSHEGRACLASVVFNVIGATETPIPAHAE